MGETYDELMVLASRLNKGASARNMMEAFPRKIFFDLKGEEEKFYVTITGGQMTVAKGVPDNVDIEIAGDSAAFAPVVQGKLDVSHTIARGQIFVKKGKVSEMTLLNRILWAKR